MKPLSILIVVSFIFLTASFGLAQTKLPSKRKVHLYLLLGQSNMAGRGELEAADLLPHPRVWAFTLDKQWEPAVEPITKDRSYALGVGPGVAFGKLMAEQNPGVHIGLIPCAVGGTPLHRWSRGGDLYSNAVVRAKEAVRHGTLKGVLWHQGENDSSREEDAKSYGERLARMISDLRTDLKQPKLPFVAGEIGEFLYTRKQPEKTAHARVINAALREIPQRVPNTACVLSAGLAHKGDEVHFDARSQRELGKRYAEEMARLQKNKP